MRRIAAVLLVIIALAAGLVIGLATAAHFQKHYPAVTTPAVDSNCETYTLPTTVGGSTYGVVC